jgi:predicted metalloprotease
VLARLVGHHVLNLLCILPKAQQAQRAADSKAEANPSNRKTSKRC